MNVITSKHNGRTNIKEFDEILVHLKFLISVEVFKCFG